jgi:hypothetical protein
VHYTILNVASLPVVWAPWLRLSSSSVVFYIWNESYGFYGSSVCDCQAYHNPSTDRESPFRSILGPIYLERQNSWITCRSADCKVLYPGDELAVDVHLSLRGRVQNGNRLHASNASISLGLTDNPHAVSH